MMSESQETVAESCTFGLLAHTTTLKMTGMYKIIQNYTTLKTLFMQGILVHFGTSTLHDSNHFSGVSTTHITCQSLLMTVDKTSNASTLCCNITDSSQDLRENNIFRALLPSEHRTRSPSTQTSREKEI